MRETETINYKNYIEKIISEVSSSDSDEKKKEVIVKEVNSEVKKRADEKFKQKISNFLFWIITGLFVISYIALSVFIYYVFCTEKEMIVEGFMDAEFRSINATTVSIMITATLTQIGLTFALLSRYAFSPKKEASE